LPPFTNTLQDGGGDRGIEVQETVIQHSTYHASVFQAEVSICIDIVELMKYVSIPSSFQQSSKRPSATSVVNVFVLKRTCPFNGGAYTVCVFVVHSIAPTLVLHGKKSNHMQHTLFSPHPRFQWLFYAPVIKYRPGAGGGGGE
jgi:hypothetical protein